jgi:flagellar protein FlbD
MAISCRWNGRRLVAVNGAMPLFLPLLCIMIKLTKLNNSEFHLNPDLIRSIEETPDTIIELINADHILVREKPLEIIDKIVAYRARILRQARQQTDAGDGVAEAPESPPL